MSIQEYTGAPTRVDLNLNLPPEIPKMPVDVRKRFPSVEGYNYEFQDFWMRTKRAIKEMMLGIVDPVNNELQNLSADQNTDSDAIEDLTQRVEALEAILYYQNFH